MARLGLYFNRPCSIGAGIGVSDKSGGIKAVRLNQYFTPCKQPKEAIAVIGRTSNRQVLLGISLLRYACPVTPKTNPKYHSRYIPKPTIPTNYNGVKGTLRGLSDWQPTYGGRDRGRA